MTDTTFFLSRKELERVFDIRSARQFEELQRRVADTAEAQTANVAATDGLVQASYVTLSPNTELPNEYVLAVGAGLGITTGSGSVTLYSTGPLVPNGHTLNFITAGDSEVVVPLTGVLVTRTAPETLSGKTLVSPALAGIGDFIDDAAAATGGVPVGGVYRNGSVLMVRVS